MRFVPAFIIVIFVLLPTYGQAQQTPDYAKHIQPIFNKYCTECHNEKKPRAGLNLETYKGLVAGSNDGSVLIPGQANKSRLVLAVEGTQKPIMPPKKVTVRPRAEEVAALRAWVRAGAKGSDIVQKVVLPALRSRVKLYPPVKDLVYLSDGKRLLAAAGDQLNIIDPHSGSVLEVVPEAPQNISAVACSRDGANIAIACGTPGAPASILFYNFPASGKTWSEPRTLSDAHGDVIQCLAFSPDGKSLVTCGYDRLVKIWDVQSATCRHTLKEHSDSVYDVAFHPNGKLFATAAADRAVKVWQTATGLLLYTLGESTDWVYAAAWSPDGKYLAAGGVDKSIRVWKVNAQGGDIVQSVFAHQGPIVRLAYAGDGKTLFSIAEDHGVKAWNARKMIEKKIYAAQSDMPLSLAVRTDGRQIAVGRFDGALLLIDVKTGKVQHQPLPIRPRTETEPNNSPRSGQQTSLSGTINGKLDKTGDVDFYRFRAKAGQPFSVQMMPAKKKGKAVFAPFLQLTDMNGNSLVQTDSDFLGYTFATDGTYALGVRDQDFSGGAGMTYQLKFGKLPIITSVFPLGVQRGHKAKIQLTGVYLGAAKEIWISAPSKATAGSKLPVRVKTPWGEAMGGGQVVVGEFPELLEHKNQIEFIPVPGTANGRLLEKGETDIWHFNAKKGERLILEVNARRLGSELDSFIEILDAGGKPAPHVTLRSQAKTFVTFRNHNSNQANIRIEAWSELSVNDYIYVGTEVMKISRLPTHPDADCFFFSRKGRRETYFGTTPTYHTKDEAMYKVSVHPPGTKFAPNGFPVVTINYRNDDGGPGFGRDSRLVFDPPADGKYLVRIGDSLNRGGENFAYRLTVRRPRPDYTVSISPANPAVWRGGALPLTVTANRSDEFDGPIQVCLDQLPAGLSAPKTTIPAGEESTTFALSADADAKTPMKNSTLKLIAEAVVNGKHVRREAGGGKIKVVNAGDIVTTTKQSEIALTPGGRTKLTVNIERRNKFKGRVPIEVLGLPHGVKVLDLGLNSILINENETSRTIVIYCHPWVEPTQHPIVISARREGRNTQHAADSVLLKIVAPPPK